MVKERKIILDLAVTLDGFIEGENGEVDWCIMDSEMNFIEFLKKIDTILYGYNSYVLWSEYQRPSNENELEMWNALRSKKKYVFSKKHTISNTEVLHIQNNILEEMIKLKKQPGKDIWLYGGASIISTFIDLKLIDELRLSIHPIVLGKGKPLFTNIKQRLNLTLLHTNVFSSGVVQLIYRTSN